jgi:hypothetical protein
MRQAILLFAVCCVLWVSVASAAVKPKAKAKSATAFSPILSPRQAEQRGVIKASSTLEPPGTNSAVVLVSSVLGTNGIRHNLYRTMPESKALKISDVNVTNPPVHRPMLHINVLFKMSWIAQVSTDLQTWYSAYFPAELRFSDTNTGARFYRSQLPPNEQNIELSWDASPSENVAGYRVYQGIAPASHLQTYDVNANTALDSGGFRTVIKDLQSGGTYYFAVTAFDGTNAESEKSNEVSYTVPTVEIQPTIFQSQSP